MVMISHASICLDYDIPFLPVERILRQQEEARLATEAERLQKEKALSYQVAAIPNLPHTTEPEKSSVASTETGASLQTMIPPTSAAGALSGIFNRHLNLQSLKRHTGLVPNELSRPPRVSEKQPVKDAPGLSPSPSSPSRPQSPMKPKDEYILNQQYLSGGEQSRLRPPIMNDDSDVMPGGFPGPGNTVTRGTNPQPTPLSDICESSCCQF